MTSAFSSRSSQICGREQLETLLKCGVTNVQPGIENLSANVLKIMDKGVTGCLNVRLLRDAESIGSQVSWNYLYGFPGEEESDYKSILEQFPGLHHLPPPDGANRIAIERFSPYFEKPELGFADIKPARTYPIIYNLPERELRDLAYIFDAPPLGVSNEIALELESAVSRWRQAYYEGQSRLTFAVIDGAVVLVSDRDAYDWHILVIDDRDEVAIFDMLAQPHSFESLARYAEESLAGTSRPGRPAGALAGAWHCLHRRRPVHPRGSRGTQPGAHQGFSQGNVSAVHRGEKTSR